MAKAGIRWQGMGGKTTLREMLKAIVFDFDGVIVDSEPLHYKAFVMVGERIGFKFNYERYLDDFIGLDDRDAFRTILNELGEQATSQSLSNRVAELCRVKQEVFEQLISEGAAAVIGSLAFIEEAFSRMPLAIASGATTRDIQLMLGQLGCSHRFDVIVSADDVERSKPDPSSYRLAWRKLSDAHPEIALKPGDCLAIEDTAAGIQSARDAGLVTLGITTTGPADRLRRAHRVIDNLDGLTMDQLHQWFD